MDLDALVDSWLTLPDVAERLGVDVVTVRSMVKDRHLVAVRRGPNSVLSVPALLLGDGRVVKGLRGALVVLADQGFDEEESVEWLFTPEPTLGVTPAQALATNQPTKVHRAAQLASI